MLAAYYVHVCACACVLSVVTVSGSVVRIRPEQWPRSGRPVGGGGQFECGRQIATFGCQSRFCRHVIITAIKALMLRVTGAIVPRADRVQSAAGGAGGGGGLRAERLRVYCRRIRAWPRDEVGQRGGLFHARHEA